VIGLSYLICVFLMTGPFYWYHIFWPCDFDLEVWPTFQNIGHIFWIASDRAFIFPMCVSYDRTFLLEPHFFTLWPWPWSLTHFSKSLTLAISFEWQVIGLSYLICVFLMMRPFYWYQFCFDLVTLTLKFDAFFFNFNFGHIFWMVSDRVVFHMHVPYDKTFTLEP
jgi:hypothetical protein